VKVKRKRAEEARKEEEIGHKYEVERCKGIGPLVNQRGKRGFLPVFLDRTFLEKLSSYFFIILVSLLSCQTHKTNIHHHN